MRKILILAAALACGLAFAPAAHADTPSQTMQTLVPVTRLHQVLPKLVAGGWSCTVAVDLATGQPATHFAFGARSYYYTCTR